MIWLGLIVLALIGGIYWWIKLLIEGLDIEDLDIDL